MPGMSEPTMPMLISGVERMDGLPGLAADLSWSPDGATLAAGLGEGPVVLLAPGGRSGYAIILPGHAGGTTSVVWHPRDPDLVASGGLDGVIRVWSASDAHEARAHEVSPIDWVQRIAWRPDGAVLAGIAGRALVVLDDDGIARRFDDHESTLTDMAWHPRGRAIAVSHYGGLTSWSPREADGAPRRFRWKGSSLRLAWSPDGRHVATGDQDSTVHFWIMKTGKDLQMWGYPRKVQELSWDSVGRHLATGGGPEVIVWDCAGGGPAGTEPVVLDVDETPLVAVAFAPAGRMLAAATDAGTLAVWDMRDPQPRGAEVDLPAAATALAWSPDGRQVAVGDADGGVSVAEIVA
jgi:WD40 repeat protein